MKRLILISALLLLASNGWSKELVVTGMVCKWTDICAYYKDDKERMEFYKSCYDTWYHFYYKNNNFNKKI